MDPASSFEPEDLSKISDEDLVRRYCADPPLREAGEILSRRCLPLIQRIVGAEVFKKGVCPPQCSKTDFFDEAVGHASLNFSKGICSFQFKARFSTWLRELVVNAVEDKRKKIFGRGINPNPIPESTDVVEEKSVADLPPVRYQSRHYIHPEEHARQNEVGGMIHSEFESYGQESKEGINSNIAIELKVLDGEKKVAIAGKLGLSTAEVDTLFRHDYAAHRKRLKEKYGITSIRQV